MVSAMSKFALFLSWCVCAFGKGETTRFTVERAPPKFANVCATHFGENVTNEK